MQVQLETLSNLERRMNIALPMAAIETQVAERLKRVARGAKIQGFRPGKAPLKIVEMNYGAQVREEVMGEQVQQGFYQAVTEQKLRVAGYPRFEPVAAGEDKENFKFAATFEVYPEVKVGELAGKEIEKPTVTVGDAEIEKTIDILRKQRTRFNRVEREAANGDRVIIDFKGVIDGVAFEGGSAENFPFVLGQGQMLAEFEAGVIGAKEGDIKSVEVSFPADYHGKDVAGKTAVFEILVKNVAEAVLPEVDADFAKALGIAEGDVEKMRAEIRKNVEREVKRRLQARTKENVMQALIDATEIELPKALVSLEIGRLVEQARRDMQQRGMNVKDMPFPPELFAAQAERRVKLGLILSEMVEANKLEAKPEQVRAMITEFADSYEQPEDVLAWYYESADRLEGPTSMVLEDNVVEFVLSQANVVSKELSFDELMGSQA
ncbi:trigger factor [Chromobacterium amazonense]|uniref:Trigger factor n=1 Tax=Chromobacterium amazonense TaxID=1382803 RepID=A0A1S1XDL0_9NEIS|nr:trigger factor [Chromobacterium amazonense]MBM2883804.1 trigger factor [Chromobacterium amazonense]MDE1711692.1 trigger factor [Chromobacterium amazonense]MDQ4540998.1 trigger factor [Chromobacterium amazonense]OHX18331.1 trigger factor [Chromobacterium amazonense]PRP71184.1 trigger factor [Chromobacterium amazonense]